MLTVGDFDERIFLGEDADEEIGTPGKSREELTGELHSSLQQHVDKVRMIFHFLIKIYRTDMLLYRCVLANDSLYKTDYQKF